MVSINTQRATNKSPIKEQSVLNRKKSPTNKFVIKLQLKNETMP